MAPTLSSTRGCTRARGPVSVWSAGRHSDRGRPWSVIGAVTLARSYASVVFVGKPLATLSP